MEFSAKAYIDRLSTEKIERFLEQYYANELDEDYTFIIPYFEYVLERRKANSQ